MIRLAAVMVAGLALMSHAAGQSYPTKPIRIILPFAAGTGSDVATRIIAEGEVLQLSKVRDASTTEETYMEVIRGKTVMLFEASTHSAAALAEASGLRRVAL